MTEHIPVLIIAFNRPLGIQLILEQLRIAGIRKVYIAVDGPRNDSDIRNTTETRDMVLRYSSDKEFDINFIFREKNAGCAVSVISSIDWFFSFEKFGIILEDDCVPAVDFFDFVTSVSQDFDSDENLWMICGSQFVPPTLTLQQPYLSMYPLVWGWATSKHKWHSMKKEILTENQSSINISSVSKFENAFWRAGRRRGLLGFTDIWDTILVQRMLAQNKQVILPGSNLISNIGNDSVAANVDLNSKWTNIAYSQLVPFHGQLKNNLNADLWLRRNVYRIKMRHLFTTKITYLLDLIVGSRQKAPPLTVRWDLNR